MKALKICFFVFAMTFMGSVQAEGLPLPWPFPWAKECPVDWNMMEGRYAMSESDERAHLHLNISVISRLGLTIVRVTRTSADGRIVADGFNVLNDHQREIRVHMYPAYSSVYESVAVIRFYYKSWELRCSDDFLVPILTIEGITSGPRVESHQYRLIRVYPGQE